MKPNRSPVASIFTVAGFHPGPFSDFPTGTMAYLNLMYRQRADRECDDPRAHSRDQKTADEWVDQALAVKKAKAEKAAAAP